MSKYMKTPRSKFSSEQGDCKFWKKLSFYITFFNLLQQKALRSAYQEPSVCV